MNENGIRKQKRSHNKNIHIIYFICIINKKVKGNKLIKNEKEIRYNNKNFKIKLQKINANKCILSINNIYQHKKNIKILIIIY